MSACVYMVKEAMQQWYHHYQAAQAHTYSTAAPQDSAATDYSKEHTQVRARCFLFTTPQHRPVTMAKWPPDPDSPIHGVQKALRPDLPVC